MTTPTPSVLEFFTKQNFSAINGTDYNPRDNRTYKMPPLSNKPDVDIQNHLAVPDNNDRAANVTVTTNKGTFFGNFFSETVIQSERLVLHMPLAKDLDINFTRIESKKLPTIYPAWLIQRYGIENLSSDLVTYAPVDIFLNKRNKEFVMFLDESFLDSIDPKLVLAGTTSCVAVYQGKNDKKYIGFSSKNYLDLIELSNCKSVQLKNNICRSFLQIADNYLALTMNAKLLEKVIVVTYFNDQDNDGMIKSVDFDSHSSAIKFNFWVGARHLDTVYPFLADGTIDTTKAIHPDRQHVKKESLFKTKSITRVMTYTQEGHDNLFQLKNRLDDINQSLLTLFGSNLATNKDDVDGSISSIFHNEIGHILKLEKK